MSNEIWSLYKKRSNEFKNIRGLPGDFKVTYNPVSLIVDIDIAMITKGLRIKGAGKKYADDNKFGRFIPDVVKHQLIDGNKFIDIVWVEENILINGEMVKKNFVQYDGYSVDKVSEVEYDQRGNIIKIVLEGDLATKTYEKINSVVYYSIEWKEEGYGADIIEAVYPKNIIPVVEFPGIKTDAEDNVSRVEGIADLIVDINQDKRKLDDIFTMHADPTIVGNFSMDDKADLKSEEDEIKFVEVPEGGSMSFLEMQGNVVRDLAQEKDKKKKELTVEYPELLLNEIASGSSMSGYAIYLKILNLISIIEAYRAIFTSSLKLLFDISVYLDDEVTLNDSVITLEPVVKYNELERINQIVTAKTNGVLNHETAAELTAALFDIDFRENWERIQKERVGVDELKQVGRDYKKVSEASQDAQL